MMILLDRALKTLLLLAVMNIPYLYLNIGPWIAILVVFFLVMEILPWYEKGLNNRILFLAGGYELILTSIAALLSQFVLIGIFVANHSPMVYLVIDILFSYLMLLFHFSNGFIRTAFCSAHLGVRRRVLMFLFWWLFPVNLILFFIWYHVVRRELLTARNSYLLETTSVENQDCRTKYPVVMVHGMFSQDWQYENYWGRIPRALKRNGAYVYYSRQQSAAAVAVSGEELKKEIFRVMEETGAEKVNIVAHSKGGLDARYAVSMLGMDQYVASLTTISAPHRGCVYLDVVLDHLPNFFIKFLASHYNTLFQTLGDHKPDSLSCIKDLTASACAKFNEVVLDKPDVYYQSTMSVMYNHRSSFLPLSLSYFLCKKCDGGENDGLVTIASAMWGNYLGLVTDKRINLNHGDTIDLTHRNVKKFDIGQYYVELFKDLKEKGF